MPKKNYLKAKTSRNIRIIKKFVKKKDLTKENDSYKILSKNNYSIKDLNDSLKRKKLMMNYLMKFYHYQFYNYF